MIRRTKIRGNGITFLYEQDQSAGGVSAALFFKCGVNYEKEKEFGVSMPVTRTACGWYRQNRECIGTDCPYFPKAEETPQTE